MRIRFSLHLDGLLPEPTATAFGEATLGPQGLLRVLESDLGLPPVVRGTAEVLLAYRGCLAEADQELRFYHASFGLDPVNVARTLQRWRAELHAEGWDGTVAPGSPVRLSDLADVEALACAPDGDGLARVPLDAAQRAARATAALAAGYRTQIGRVLLLDAPEELPAAWRALVEQLGYDLAPGVAPQPQAPEGTDLHRVQCALQRIAAHEGRKLGEPTRLACDGSVVILRGVSRDVSAQAIAEHIRARGAPERSLVIAERDGIVLDNALERAGLPRAGFLHFSRFRAVTQFLKLGLGLVWKPVSPQLLLQFLVHPVGPLRRHVRAALADAMAAQPGIGGTAWRQALARIDRHMRENFGADEREIGRVHEAIELWLGCERWHPREGAPVRAIAARTQRAAIWLAGRRESVEDEAERVLWGDASAQAVSLGRALDALAALERATIDRNELERLVDEASGVSSDPNGFSQAGHVRATTVPGAATTPWDRVYWWDLAQPGTRIGRHWSRREIAALADHGVTLPAVEDTLAQRTRQWLRPILNASRQLVVAVHDSEQGYHPLWTQMMSLFSNLPVLRLDEALFAGEALPTLGIPTRPLPLVPLPAPRRRWQLPPAAKLAPRETESYSSLSKLLDYPHAWVMRYPARLRPGRARNLVDGNRLYGEVAHRLFERFFDEHPLWTLVSADAVREWSISTLATLIEQEAAVLLEPGRGVDRERVSTTLELALAALLQHLRSAGAERVQAELSDAAPFEGISIAGTIDLLLTDARGRETVVDVKWGGDVYRGGELAAHRHVQLATYAYLRRQSTRRWPGLAFFVIASGNVLAQDATKFPDAATFAPADGATIEDLWRRIVGSYRWRRRQLESGCIEVNVAATALDEPWLPPPDALEGVAKPDNFEEFSNLTGWEPWQ